MGFVCVTLSKTVLGEKSPINEKTTTKICGNILNIEMLKIFVKNKSLY